MPDHAPRCRVPTLPLPAAVGLILVAVLVVAAVEIHTRTALRSVPSEWERVQMYYGRR